MDRWRAIGRLLVFGDERGTVSERAEQVSAEAGEIGTRLEATTENAAHDIRRNADVLRDLLDTFPRRA